MITELTKAQEDRFDEFVSKWINIGLCTKPANRPMAENAIKRLYSMTGLGEPDILWLDSPLEGVMGAIYYATLIDQYDKVYDKVYAKVRDKVDAKVSDKVSHRS